MSFTEFDPAPAAPSPGESGTTFSDKAFAFVAWMATIPAALNNMFTELLDFLNGAYSGTSASSVTIGTGTKSFTTQSGRVWSAGQWLLVASRANPANYMLGQVTSYSGTALEIGVLSTGIGGSGTFSDWDIGLLPAPINRTRSYPQTTFGSALSFNSDLYDIFTASAQDAACTISADAGDAVDGRKAVFRITASGASRMITFTGGVAGGFHPHNSTLIASGDNWQVNLADGWMLYAGCIYNAATDRWDIVALSQAAA